MAPTSVGNLVRQKVIERHDLQACKSVSDSAEVASSLSPSVAQDSTTQLTELSFLWVWAPRMRGKIEGVKLFPFVEILIGLKPNAAWMNVFNYRDMK